MRLACQLLCVPTSLLLLISTYSTSTSCHEAHWPYNLPPHVKYFPEDELLVRRNVDLQGKLLRQRPVGMRKMTTDKGEMFFLEYWRFEEGQGDEFDGPLKRRTSDIQMLDNPLDSFNTSILQSPKPPLLQHESHENNQRPLLARYLNLQRMQIYPRDFICPTGTSNCSYINQPNSCCENGLTCNIVPDTGLGVVGCCAGSSCSGQVASCPASYTSCPSSQGGGCCIPGYVCSGVGCKFLHKPAILEQHEADDRARHPQLHRHGRRLPDRDSGSLPPVKHKHPGINNIPLHPPIYIHIHHHHHRNPQHIPHNRHPKPE